MRKLLMTLAVAAGLLTGAAAGASASTVSVTPGGAVSGSAGASQFIFLTARRTFACTGTTFAATYIAGTFSGVTLPYTLSTNVDLRFTSCRMISGPGVTITCTRTARLDAVGISINPDGITPLGLSSISCAIVITSTTCSVTVSGVVAAIHTDRGSTLSVNITGQVLAATGSTCATLPNDTSVGFWNTVGGPVTYAESPTQGIAVT